MHSIQDSDALLMYKVGPVLVCSPTMQVESVTIPPALTTMPGTNVSEPGMFKSIHGMVRVVDLRVRFGVDPEDRKDPGTIIVVEVEGGHAGFWVDLIEDVVKFPAKGWSQVPTHIPRQVFSRTLVEADKKIRLYADFEKLDAFKAMGYLRKHIEVLKEEEAKKNTAVQSSNDSFTDKIPAGGHSKQTHVAPPEDRKFDEVSEQKSLQQENAIKKDALQIDSASIGDNKAVDHSVVKVPDKIKDSTISTEKEMPGANKAHASTIRKSALDNKYKPASIDKSKVSSTKLQNSYNQHKQAADNTKSNASYSGVNTSLKAGSDRVFTESQSSENSSATANENNYSSNRKNISYKDKSTRVSSNANDDNGLSILWMVLLLLLLLAGFIYLLINIDISVDEEKNIVESQFRKEKTTSRMSDEKLVVPDEYSNKQKEPLKGLSSDAEEGMMHNEGMVEINKSEEGVVIVVDEPNQQMRVESEQVIDESSQEAVIPDEVIETDVVESDGDASDDEINDEKNETILVSEKQDIAENDIVQTEELVSSSVVTQENALLSEREKIEVVSERNKNKVRKDDLFIHVVVKGDTLWHIAKRYVNNPWRYPELARLSKIKNPDLIYPGDKVTIIIRYQNN